MSILYIPYQPCSDYVTVNAVIIIVMFNRWLTGPLRMPYFDISKVFSIMLSHICHGKFMLKVIYPADVFENHKIIGRQICQATDIIIRSNFQNAFDSILKGNIACV